MFRIETMIVSHQAHLRSRSKPTPATMEIIETRVRIAAKATMRPTTPAYCGNTVAIRAAPTRRRSPPRRPRTPNKMVRTAKIVTPTGRFIGAAGGGPQPGAGGGMPPLMVPAIAMPLPANRGCII